MRNIRTALIIAFVVLLVGGVIVSAVWKVRQSAERTQCVNNLKQLGLGLQSYHDANKRFPTGTLVNPDLAPEKRFSWLAEICPAYIESSPGLAIDRNKAWDVRENCPPKWRRFDAPEWGGVQEERVAGVIHILVCPAVSLEHDPLLPCLTSYPGVTGVGNNAAQLPLENVNAGIFGYERKVSAKDCKHGSETTIMVAETLNPGPWTAGGHATMRGVELDKLPYFGMHGQFASNHPGGSNVIMADASVRFFTTSISPRVVEAMAALAGDKDIARFDD